MNIINIAFDAQGKSTVTLTKNIQQGDHLTNKLRVTFYKGHPTISTVRLHAQKPDGSVTPIITSFESALQDDVWEYKLESWFTEYAGILTISVSVQFAGEVEGYETADIILYDDYAALEAAAVTDDTKALVTLDDSKVFVYDTNTSTYEEQTGLSYEIPKEYQRSIKLSVEKSVISSGTSNLPPTSEPYILLLINNNATRISILENTTNDHEERLDAAEPIIASNTNRIVTLESDKADKTELAVETLRIDRILDGTTIVPKAYADEDGTNIKANYVRLGDIPNVAVLEDGKIPSEYLPSFVDDVLEYDSIDDFPEIGETGKIYVDKNSNLSYRWSGSVYVVISQSLALGETSSTAHRGDHGKSAYDHSQTTDGSNPHNTAFSNIASKPTTISGYGIEDAYNKTEIDQIIGVKNLTNFTNGELYNANGIIITYDASNYTISIIGTSSSALSANIGTLFLPAGTYTFGRNDNYNMSGKGYFEIRDNAIPATRYALIVNDGVSSTFTLSSDTTIRFVFVILNGITINYTSRYQINVGSSLSSFAPQLKTEIDVIKDNIDRKIIVHFKSSILNIYVPSKSSKNYMLFTYKKVVDAGSDMNQWKTYEIKILDDNFSVLTAFTTDIEWDGVLKENGEADFMGGFHGSETNISLTCLIDGKLYDLDTSPDFKEYINGDIRLIAKSTLNRVSNPSTNLFTRYKINTWSDGKYIVENKLIALDDVTLDHCYLTMMSIPVSVVDYVQYDDNYLKTAVGSTAATLLTGVKDVEYFEMFSSNERFYAKVSAYANFDDYINSLMFAENINGTHAKVYFDLTGSASITSGDILKSKSIFEFNF